MANDPWKQPQPPWGGQPQAPWPAAGPSLFPPPPGYNPYPQPQFAPRPKRHAGWIIFGIIFGVAGVIVVGCGLAGFGIVRLGMTVVADAVENQLGDNPVLREQIGELESVESDFAATSSDFDEPFVFHVRGDRGEGRITAQLSADNQVLWARLKLPSGEEFELVPAAGASNGSY
jgi:hypothetical protein